VIFELWVGLILVFAGGTEVVEFSLGVALPKYPSIRDCFGEYSKSKGNQTSSRRTAQVKRPVFWNLGQILVALNLAHAPFF
jgi:hypothetical protein